MMKPRVPELASLSDERIQDSLSAAAEIRECYRVLERAGLNVVGEVLKGQSAFFELDHYPKDDVYDGDNASQYYYHAHREDHVEHGHFHLFLRDQALPSNAEPHHGPRGEERVVHLAAISMDAWGYPTDLFTVNRWVTDDSWLPAPAIGAILDRFKIDHAHPSWPVNRWLTAMVRCFHPQIAALLRHRDAFIASRGGDLGAVLEDRSLEVIGSMPIDLESWERLLTAEQSRRRCVSPPAQQADSRLSH